ncbi:hypothetical protein DUI87_06780 [Hirundo rustica rustica]|uniref:Corticotropin-releasing factor-binding protein n=1 Tax=Hirundo rustica rustica TaxID=333673 RepID=A0A3M0L0C2_HIRRU|nr:hypothetical protein DUI87_06780 [Hirundo rustica rustica]
MPSAFQFQCHLVLIFLAASKGETRYLEVRDAGEDDPFLLLSEDLKRELSAGQIYRRSLRCIDMLSIEGQFTFTADQPQLHCATFFIGEPEELITIRYDFVNIDCRGGGLPEAQMKIGCDNTVLRMVSSGKHINRVTFEYHQLDPQETETRKENSIEEFCFPSI